VILIGNTSITQSGYSLRCEFYTCCKLEPCKKSNKLESPGWVLYIHIRFILFKQLKFGGTALWHVYV